MLGLRRPSEPTGWKSVQVIGKILPLLKKPGVPEADFSGVVAEDSADGKWKKGQEVFGIKPTPVVMSCVASALLLETETNARLSIRSGKGSLAEYINVKTGQIQPKPASLPFPVAAAVPLAGLTAYVGLVHLGKLQSGQKVFINAASGGVGTFAVQIAKTLGAYVVATGSGDKKQLVKDLGADEVIDYRETDVTQYLKDHYGGAAEERLDLCFDTYGSHELYVSSLAWLKPSTAQYVDCGGDVHSPTFSAVYCFVANMVSKYRPRILGNHGPPYRVMIFNFNAGGLQVTKEGGDLEILKGLLEEGKVKPVVDSQWDFVDYLKAYERQMSGRVCASFLL